MKKINLLITIFLAASLSMFAQNRFSQTTALTCFVAPTGTSFTQTITTNFLPSGDGTLTVYYQGDVDFNTETIDVFDENNNLIGATVPAPSGQCSANLDSVTFTIPRADLQSWLANQSIDFTLDPDPSIGFFCTPCSGAQLKLEFDVIQASDDAAVTAVDSPSVFCAGVQDVYATIANFGINQIDSVDVNWEVNGVAQPTFSLIALLDTIPGTLPFDTLLNLGSATFNAGTNTIRVFTSLPNGVADTSNFNDTLDIVVETALDPANVTRFNPTVSSIDIDADNIANQLDYEVVLRGQARGTGTTGSSTTVPFTITGLNSGTEYSIYVRNNCGSGDTSLWFGPFPFLTSYALPYFQDFEAFAVPTFQNPWPEGWSSTSSVNFIRWESEDANGFNENSLQTGPLFDHTLFGSVGGNYIYFEAGFSGNDTASFLSPPIEIPANRSTVEISYWYFNYGIDIDRMVVSVDTNGVSQELKTYFGQQQTAQTDEWRKESIYLSGYAGTSIRLRFDGYRPPSIFTDDADLAIDDVAVDTVPDLNASVEEIIEPSGALCPGAVNPVVAIRNRGLNGITSVDVVTDINGTLDTTAFTFAALVTGDSLHVTLPSVTFNSGTTYDIKVYTQNPNAGVDEVAGDDTLSLNGLNTGLTGAVTIDPSLAASATNFTSFDSFSDEVNAVGVCGAVTVTVAAGSYTDNIRLINVPGTSPTDRLVIDGVDPDSVTLSRGTNNGNGTVVFEGSSYITIKNMTIRNTSGGGDQFGVHFSRASSYDSIVNCNIEMSPTATFGFFGVGASADITNDFAEGNNANFITVMDCEITGGAYSVHFEGPAFGNWNVGNSFINNNMLNIYNYGFYMDQQDSLTISGNTIRGDRNNFSAGIYVFDGMNFDVSANDIIVQRWALYLINANSGKNPDREANVINNMVTSLDDFGRGIYLTNPLRINMYHNSVRSLGSSNPAVEFNGFGFIDSLDVRNNIFSSRDGIAFEMNGAADTSAFLRFDNNVYHNENTGGLISMGSNTNSPYNTLAAYQTDRPGFNINSLDGQPSFISDSNLHIVGILVNDAGDNGVNILTDIDGDPRPSPNATFVDPGADEYDPPACPSPIAFNVNLETPDSITVSWMSGFPGSVVEYNWTISGNGLGTGDLDSSTTDTVGIGNLVPTTTYDIWIREICRRGDTSLWLGPITFEMPCAPYTARYTMDFDSETLLEPATCWEEYNPGGQVNAYADVRNGFVANNGNSSPNALVMYSWNYSSATDTLAAISPEFTDMISGNTEVSFYANTSNATSDLFVWTTDAQDGTGTYTAIDTISFTTPNVWTQHYVELTTANGYNGTDEYVVFAHGLNSTFTYMRVDDFTYDTIPSCRAPRDLTASNISANDADLGWTDPAGASSWQIEIDTLGFTSGSGFDTVVTSNPAAISGLTSNTVYEYRVRAICGVGDTSLWTTRFEFQTACDPFTRGYFVDFDAMTVDEAPDCWFTYESTDQLNATVQVDNGFVANNGFSSPNALVMYSWNLNAATDSMYAITPQFSDMSTGLDKQVKFQLNTSDTSNVLYVSTADRQGSNAVFTAIDTFEIAAPNQWQEEIVYLTAANGYNGTDEYVVFSHSLNSTFTYMRIDDVEYDTVPSCPKPNKLAVSAVGADSASFNWVNPSGSTTWEIQVGESGFTLGQGLIDSLITSNPIVLYGLTANTFYEFTVRSICGAGDTSLWSNRFEFRTDCVPFNNGYFTDFDIEPINQPAGCWAEYNSGGQVNAYAEVRNGFVANNGLSSPNATVMYSWNYVAGTDTLAAITPEFADMTAGDKRIRFHGNTSNTNASIIVMTADGQTPNSNYAVIDTLSFGNPNVWNEFVVDLNTLNGYNGTDNYVVLAHDLGQTFTYLRIDDFHYEDIPTCFRPTGLTGTSPAPDTAILSWTDPNGATEWEITYGAAGFDPDTGGTKYYTTSNPDTLGGLASGTKYDYYLRAICTVGDTSYARRGFFETACNNIFAPYFTGFENDLIDSVPGCWVGFSSLPPSPNQDNSVQGFNVRTGSRTLVINSWNGTSTDRVTQTLPRAGDITPGDKRVRFWLRTDNVASSLIVGTAVDSGSLATINTLQTLTPTANQTYQEFTVDITTTNGYNGTDEFIVLQHNMGSTFTSLYVDDFNYEEIPSCVRPTALSGTSMPTGDSAELNWTEVNTATEWEIRYGAPGFDPDTATGFITTNNPDTITGLATGTPYDFYVRSICTVGDTSRWSLGNFQTDCQPVSAPYTNGFENDAIDSIPVCWDGFQNFNQVNATFTVEGPGFVGQPRTGIRSLVLYSWNGVAGTDRVTSVTPEFTDMTNGDKRIDFYLSTSNLSSDLIVGTSNGTDANAAFNPMDTLSVATVNTWERKVVELTTANGYNGTDTYVMLEHSMGANFSYVRIDDFEYEQFLSCLTPTNVAAFNIGSDSVDLTWGVLDTATQWQIEYGTRGYSRGSGTKQIANADTATISGLAEATYYDVYVRAICGAGDTSRWSTKHTFLTACDLLPRTLPFFETWDSGLNGVQVGNGVIVCDTTYSWIFNTAKTQGRLRYGTNAVAKANGSVGAITMDIASGFELTKNELILSLNLFAYNLDTTMELSFYMRDHGDEVHAGDRIWIRGSVSDPWIEVFNVATNATPTYTKYTVDLDAPLYAAGQSFTSSFQIKFGQEDDGQTPNDGVSFDSIAVRGAIPVGISNTNPFENSILVYPNPSTGLFNLNINTTSRQNFNMMIRDVKGKIIYTNNVSVNGTYKNQLDLTGWSKGIYYLQILSETESRVEKLIVQ
ncbi:MAG: T9SS type A sorting domain-containing protein [Vicingaceae bacterium]